MKCIREVTGLNWEHSLPSTDFVVYHSLGTKLRHFAREGGRKSKHTFTTFSMISFLKTSKVNDSSN